MSLKTWAVEDCYGSHQSVISQGKENCVSAPSAPPFQGRRSNGALVIPSDPSKTGARSVTEKVVNAKEEAFI